MPIALAEQAVQSGAGWKEDVSRLDEGETIHLLSDGEWALSEMIEHLVALAGRCELTVSVWTANKAQIADAYRLLGDDRVTACRFLVDRSFPSRQPDYCDALLDTFGAKSVRLWDCHAKFVIVDAEAGEKWLCVTSANLNSARRIENFTISRHRALAGAYLEVVADLWSRQGDGEALRDGSVARRQTGEMYKSFAEKTQSSRRGVSKNGLASRLGWTYRRVQKLVEKEILPPTPWPDDGEFLLQVVAQLESVSNRRAINGGPVMPTELPSEAELRAEKLRIENDINLIKRDEMAGELLAKDDVREHVGSLLSQMARDMNALRGQLKARMPELTPHALDWLDAQLARIRNTAASGKWEESSES